MTMQNKYTVYPTEKAAARVAAYLAGVEYMPGQIQYEDEDGWTFTVEYEGPGKEHIIEIDDDNGHHHGQHWIEDPKGWVKENPENPTQPLD
jgi:hypothetical protein